MEITKRKAKDLSFNVQGDLIEVLLRDNDFRTFFRGTANINNKKQMLVLLATLKFKGIDIFKLLKSKVKVDMK